MRFFRRPKEKRRRGKKPKNKKNREPARKTLVPRYRAGTARNFLWELKKTNPSLFKEIEKELWEANNKYWDRVEALEKKDIWKSLEIAREEHKIIVSVLKTLKEKISDQRIERWIKEEENRVKAIDDAFKKKNKEKQ
jgi:hypothetical protein